MTAVSILPQAEFVLDEYREDAPLFTKCRKLIKAYRWRDNPF